MSSSNLGSSKVTVQFKNKIRSDDFNTYLRNIIKPGVYQGWTLSILTPSTRQFQVSTGKAWFNAPYISDNLGVSVETQGPIIFTAGNPAKLIVYVTYTWQNVVNNFADWFIGDLADLAGAVNPIVIGELVLDGANNLVGFNYDDRSRGMLDADNDNSLTTDVSPTQDYHIGNRLFNDLRYSTPGFISGGLKYDTATTAPAIRGGVYEVNGRIIKLTTDTTIPLISGAIKKSLSQLDSHVWYNIISDELGNFYYILATGTAIAGASGTATTITNPSASTKRITINTGSLASVAVGHIVMVKNTTNNDGVFKIIATNASTTVDFDSNDNLTDTGGDYAIYSRITTKHLFGTNTQINVNADIAKFTPSNIFNPGRNGFYLNADGINTSSASTYRILGVCSSDASSNIKYIYSYKIGDNKDDNFLTTDDVDTGVNYGVSDGIGMPLPCIVIVHGDIYEFYNTGSAGFRIIAKRNLDISYAHDVYQIANFNTTYNQMSITIDNLRVARNQYHDYAEQSGGEWRSSYIGILQENSYLWVINENTITVNYISRLAVRLTAI